MSKVEYKTCPYCGEEIKKVALKCKHCKMLLYDENLLKDQQRQEANSITHSSEEPEFIDVDHPSQRSKTNPMIYLIPTAILALLVGFVIYVGSNQAEDDENDFTEIASIEAEEAEPISIKVTDSYVVVDVPSTSSLNLRDKPTTDGNILKRLFKGEELKLLDTLTNTSDELWVQVISTDGLEGWVHSDYVAGKPKPSTANEIFYDSSLPILLIYWLYDDRDSFWSDWESEIYLFYGKQKLNFNLTSGDIIDLMGEPLSIEKDSVHYDDDYMILQYPSMSITCFAYVDPYQTEPAEDFHIVGFNVQSADIAGPRGIRVGDSFESLLRKVPNSNNPIEPLQFSYDINGETVNYSKVIYGSDTRTEPYARILYNDNRDPVVVEFYDTPFGGFGNSALYISIKNNMILDYRLTIQFM